MNAGHGATTVDGPDLVQLLTPGGELLPHAEYALALTDEQWRARYCDLVIARRLDAEATALQRQGELGLWASCEGQEAAQVGAAHATRATDRIFPSYREHAMAFVRGVDPVSLLGLFRGTTTGGWDPADHGFSLYSVVLGDQTLHAVGYAMGIQRDGADEAVLACFGDGAAAQGDVAESFIYAAVNDAPVVFFCQNNQYAISESNELQTRAPIYRRAAGYGFPGVLVDGNDVLAVEAVVTTAMNRARSGGGPTLVEAYTYRMGAHTTSDDPTRYRSSAETEAWRRRDPIDRVRTHLVRSGIADERYLADVAEQADGLSQRLRTQCRALPDPPPEAMFAHLYARDHPEVEHDRRWLADYLAGFADVERDQRPS